MTVIIKLLSIAAIAAATTICGYNWVETKEAKKFILTVGSIAVLYGLGSALYVYLNS